VALVTFTNPVPGTKSTQSRYWLGYMVFVDAPDTGYAVAVRAPDRDVGIERAFDKAQSLSDSSGKAIAFIPVGLSRATKAQAVRHLYGGTGSREYGGPHAQSQATLSRTRIPNRKVANTALASVEAHWASLYGPTTTAPQYNFQQRLRSPDALRVQEGDITSPVKPRTPQKVPRTPQKVPRTRAQAKVGGDVLADVMENYGSTPRVRELAKRILRDQRAADKKEGRELTLEALQDRLLETITDMDIAALSAIEALKRAKIPATLSNISRELGAQARSILPILPILAEVGGLQFVRDPRAGVEVWAIPPPQGALQSGR
jgi:hypothetical protein